MSTAFYPLGMKSYNNSTNPKGYRTWKGDGIFANPITSIPVNIRPMTNKDYENNTTNKFGLPKPLRHYRKGRIVAHLGENSSRAILSRNDGTLVSKMIDIPGGNCIDSTLNLDADIKHRTAVVNYYPPQNLTLTPEVTSIDSSFCCNAEQKARRRVRPASTLLKKNYYTNLQNYRENRCMTFQQQSFNFQEKEGDDLPNNAFKPNCFPNNSNSSCQYAIYKPNNSKYAKQGAVSSSLNTLNNKVTSIEKSASKQNNTLLKAKTAPCSISSATSVKSKAPCYTYISECAPNYCK